MSNDTQTILTLVEGLSDFNKERIIGGLCYSTNNQMKFTRDKINEVVSQLRDLNEHYTGSEVQTSYMESKTEYCQTLEDQYHEMYGLHEAAQEAMETEFDKRWVVPSKPKPLDKTKTAAKQAAEELLAKYS